SPWPARPVAGGPAHRRASSAARRWTSGASRRWTPPPWLRPGRPAPARRSTTAARTWVQPRSARLDPRRGGVDHLALGAVAQRHAPHSDAAQFHRASRISPPGPNCPERGDIPWGLVAGGHRVASARITTRGRRRYSERPTGRSVLDPPELDRGLLRLGGRLRGGLRRGGEGGRR